MLIISESDIKQSLPMNDVITSVRMAFKDYSDGLVDVPPRVTMNVRRPANSVIFLTANYLSMPYYGVKQASSFPTNREKGLDTVLSDIHLYCADTGEPLAVISANHLTAMKTGAAAAVATDLLAKSGEAILAIIGTGIQARTQLAAIQEIRPIKQVRLFNRNREKAEQFAEYVNEVKTRQYQVVVADSSDECVYGADIISTCTTSSRPVFAGEQITEGAHINAIGAFTPEMQEIDAKTIAKADKIVTDNTQETWAAAGDLLMPLKEGTIDRSKLYGELGDVVSGKLAGRETDEEVTIYESIGFAALDIAVAVAAYNKLKPS